ncbi:MAG: hypothetical protein HRU00_06340 [Myxococcales bacterium]|nr:hypothetical protein [Myxococcales bacterium]
MSLRILTACLLLCAASSNAATPTDDEIVDQIYRQTTEFEEAFAGVYFRQNVTVRELDPDDGELRKTKTMVQDVWSYVGAKPRVEILSCTVDGKQSEIEACKPKDRGGDRPYRVFGPDGRKHYRFELEGPEELNGISVYRLRPIPLERTSRHLDIELFYTVDGLRLVASNGTIADYPMGLKKLAFENWFDELDGHPVMTKSKLDMTIYFPLLVNLRVVNESTASEQRLIASDDREEPANPAVSSGGVDQVPKSR